MSNQKKKLFIQTPPELTEFISLKNKLWRTGSNELSSTHLHTHNMYKIRNICEYIIARWTKKRAALAQTPSRFDDTCFGSALTAFLGRWNRMKCCCSMANVCFCEKLLKNIICVSTNDLRQWHIADSCAQSERNIVVKYKPTFKIYSSDDEHAYREILCKI